MFKLSKVCGKVAVQAGRKSVSCSIGTTYFHEITY